MTSRDHPKHSTVPGTVYLVGAGPGDPGLMTLRGLQLIRSADVIVYDHLADSQLLADARPGTEFIYAGKKGKDHTLEQPEINEVLVARAREGKTVVRLKGGDPFVFGRGGEEAEELVAEGIPFEVVPGVTSAVAAPAYAGIPVTHREHASMVTFVTGHEDPTKEESAIDWELLARNPGTLVFLMGVKNLAHIADSLMRHGKAPVTAAAVVRWGTTPQQVSVIATLATIAEEAARHAIKPPAVLVVGSVVVLSNSLGWFEKRPLFGKTILVTRSREQSRGMAERIAELGGHAVMFPTIAIQPPSDYGPLDDAIERIGDFDWVIFTSVNGVERFFERFFELRGDIRSMAGPRLGAIGPVTSAAMEKRGLKVDLLAKEFKAEGVLAELAAQDVKGKRFLIARAENAREILPDGIAAMGGEVEVVPAYCTTLPSQEDVQHVRRLLERNEIDVITFTSSSTATHFAKMLGNENLAVLTQGVLLASIGPVTSRTLVDKGLGVGVEASEYTIEGLLAALVQHFKETGEKPDCQRS